MQISMRNHVSLVGNLGQAPKTTEYKKDKKVARFSIATSEVYFDAKGQRQQNTTWHNIVAWGRNAEIVEEYLDKGNKVALSGKIVNRQYNDKDDVKRSINEIHATEIILFEKPQGNSNTNAPF